MRQYTVATTVTTASSENHCEAHSDRHLTWSSWHTRGAYKSLQSNNSSNRRNSCFITEEHDQCNCTTRSESLPNQRVTRKSRESCTDDGFACDLFEDKEFSEFPRSEPRVAVQPHIYNFFPKESPRPPARERRSSLVSFAFIPEMLFFIIRVRSSFTTDFLHRCLFQLVQLPSPKAGVAAE